MSAPIIPADQWPEGAHLHTWDSNGLGNWLRPSYGAWHLWASDIPLPPGHDWRVPVMRPTCKESLPVAPAIDLGKLRAFAESVIDRGHRGDCESRHRADNRCDCGMGQTKQEAKDLLALIDGLTMYQAVPANVATSSAHSSPCSAHSEDVRIARIIAEKIDEGRLDHPGFYKNGRLSAALRNLLALIDGQANVRSSSEHNEAAPAIDLLRVRASMQSMLNWIDDWAETPEESGIAEIAEEAEAVLALIDGQGVGERPKKGRCPNNAAPGGCQLPNRFCTFPSCDKADELQPTKGEGVAGGQ